MLDLNGFKGIIFDMDGTLIDSMGGHSVAWQKTCEQFGYPFDAEYMHNLGGVPTLETVDLLNEKYVRNHDRETVANFKNSVRAAMQDTPELIQDTHAIFTHYRPFKKIAVGTGAERSHAEFLLAHHGLLSSLDALVTASDVENGKPAPDTFLSAASQMGLKPEDCVVFEDTEIGKQAATRAGMHCIMVVEGKVRY
ncbi:beta-phosphoglucomutase family hydrolase [Aestuariibacter sp. A3R04]|uniref:beta-phosphoglucomutase family hydrolase n=1 Tax=Aestuariibacter sp. A3R04 TaxID=2841571 RepID=UPI001C09B558|nr:beta-phosphoglucomutase family hydrolase [Aestuariibacter sp. A3R04]MBU3020602.1 beta-phosphoglucomutase family hydrolase [Aestuariibacter sp. A3R04]